MSTLVKERRYLVKDFYKEKFVAKCDWTTKVSVVDIHEAALFHNYDEACIVANECNENATNKFVVVEVNFQYTY